MQINILACASAVSTMLPPMIILKGEQLNHEWTRGEIPGTRCHPKDGLIISFLWSG